MYLDSKGRRTLSYIIASVIILGILVLALVIPKTHITLTLQKKIFKQQFDFTFMQGVEKPLLPLDILPAYPRLAALSSSALSYIPIKGSSLIARDDDIKALIVEKLQSKINADETVDHRTLDYTLEIIDEAKLKARIYAQVTITHKLDLNALKKEIQGKRTTSAKGLLEQKSYITKVQIDSAPAWLPFIPLLSQRIGITKN